ncbi:DUF7146 domain-containing protein (plasmid) [Thalassospira sp. SM2505]
MADIEEVKASLNARVLDVCKSLFGNVGYIAGRYYKIGSIGGEKGQSMYVHLSGPKAGYWLDTSTGERGDIIDLIRLNKRLNFPDAVTEGLRILRRPIQPQSETPKYKGTTSGASARGFYKSAQQFNGSLAEKYLKARHIELPFSCGIRFHPKAYKRISDTVTHQYPAMVAPITNTAGEIIGAARYFLEDDGRDVRRSMDEPKTIMGDYFGNGIKIGSIKEEWGIGEGFENLLSVLMAVSHIPLQSCLTAGSMEAVIVPATVRRLYVFLDNDDRGRLVWENLQKRKPDEFPNATLVPVWPVLDDFNNDLKELGLDLMRDNILLQAPDLER